MKSNYKEIGRVVEIHRHPVKSMAGESVDRAHLGWQGFDGDRRYAFTRTGDLSGLPWLSAREFPGLIGFRAVHDEPNNVRSSSISVIMPNGTMFPVRSFQLRDEIAKACGAPVHLMHLHRGAFDAMAVSLITTQSLASLAEQAGREVEARRFRANVVVEAFADRAFPEERWVGEVLVFGDGEDAGRLHGDRRDKRCSIVNVNPDTGVVDATIHKTIVAIRKNMLGMYASPERPGTVAVEDTVYIRS